MATDRTVSGAAFAAVGVPLAATVTSTLGTDYNIAGLRAGPVTASGSTPVVMEATGEPTSTPTWSLTAKVVRAGTPSAGEFGGGFAYALGGDWRARERPSLLTGYQRVTANNGDRCSAVALADGTVVLGYDDDGIYKVQVRSAAGVWGSATTVAGGGAGGVTTCSGGVVIAAPDGYLLAYVAGVSGGTDYRIACFRSINGGTTWTVQRSDCTGDTFAVADDWHLRASVDAQAGVVLFVSKLDGTSSLSSQYYAADGGFSFSIVNPNIPTFLVWDVQRFDGAVHILTTEERDTATQYSYFHRRIGSASEPAISAARTEIVASNVGSFADGAFWSSLGYPGLFWVTYFDSVAIDWVSLRTENGGVDWLSYARGPGIVDAGATNKAIVRPCAVGQRGTVYVIGLGEAVPQTVELAYGGNTDVTAGTDVPRMAEVVFIPTQTLANTGWTNTDTGAVTRTVSAATGETIDASGGGPAVSTWLGTTSDAGYFYVCATPSGDTSNIYLSITDSTHGYIVDLRENGAALEMRVYGVGAIPGAYQTIGNAGDYIDLLMVVDGTSGYLWWRIRDNASEREWNTTQGAGAITTGAVDATYVANTARIEVPATDVGIVLFCWPEWAATPKLQDGITRPDELYPIPLTAAPAYTTNGVGLRLARGTIVADGVTHTVGFDSPYRVENVLASRAPSPAVVWRTSGLTDQLITLTLTDDGDLPLAGLWLGGMKWVKQVVVKVDGSTEATLDLSISYPYQASGSNSIQLRASSAGRWVKADELAGWGVVLADGTCRTIRGNSDGMLASASGSRVPPAVLYLDGAHDSPGGSATASLLPPSTLIVMEDLGITDTMGIQIVQADNPTPADGYREVGLIVPLRMHALGRSPDLSDEWSTQNNAAVLTEPDGKRYSARRSADRRAVRVAWVGSTQEVREVEGTSADPDYITAPFGPSEVGPHTGIPYQVDGIARRAAGLPVVWAPSLILRADDNVTNVTARTTHTGQPMWCRIVNGVSIEGVQYIGTRGASQVFRVPAITFEEEL